MNIEDCLEFCDGIYNANLNNNNNNNNNSEVINNSIQSISQVEKELRQACINFTERGLLNTSKWCSEQLIGIIQINNLNQNNYENNNNHQNSNNNNNNTNNSLFNQTDLQSLHDEDQFIQYEKEEINQYLMAKSLFDLKEYKRCAFYLQNTRSFKSCFLRLYSLYLLGEKTKNEQILIREPLVDSYITTPDSGKLSRSMGAGQQQRKQNTSSPAAATNPELSKIHKELSSWITSFEQQHKQNQSEFYHYFQNQNQYSLNDENNNNNNNENNNNLLTPILNYKRQEMSYLYYLSGVVHRLKYQTQSSINALISAVEFNPLLWCAWQELASLCHSKETFCEILSQHQRRLPRHWITDMFFSHVLIELQQPELALTILLRLRQHLFPHSPYIASQIAVANYLMPDFVTAEEEFQNLHQMDPYRLETLDTYSNILFVTDNRIQLSVLAHAAHQTDKYRAETCCIVGNYYSLRNDHHKALIYFARALKLDPNYLSAWTLIGHECVELKNTSGAVYAYRRAVDINPRDYRAWYGLGQIYELQEMFRYALYYYRKATMLRPYDERMWCALADCYKSMGSVRDAIRCYNRARSNSDPQDTTALDKLAALYIQNNDRDSAAECYLGLVQACDANYQQEEGEDLTASENPSAIYFLASYFNEKSMLQEAKQYCTRLLDVDAPERNQAKALLREIRSKLSSNSHVYDTSGMHGNSTFI